MAILSVREGIDFGTQVTTDSAPLHRLVSAMLAVDTDSAAVHALRDPTRGGLVAAVVEIARAASVGVELDEAAIPVPDAVFGLLVSGARSTAGGKIVVFVDPAHSDRILDAMRSRPDGIDAARIGRVVPEHPGMVVGRTAFGTTRVIERELGEQLPRIC